MMSAALRLAVLLALLAALSKATLFRGGLGTPVAFTAGALLLCSLFAGKLARSMGLPRLTGYILIGVALGPYALGFIPHEGVKGLELLKGLAVSLIALVAGTELHWGLIRRVGPRVAVLCAIVSGATLALTMGAMLLLKPWLPFLAPLTWPQALCVSALVASVVVSFSPSVTIALVQETEARGTFTEFLMSMVIIGDLFVMVLFAVATGVTRASFGAGLDVASLLGGVGWELFGSVALGGVLGVALLVYVRTVQRELSLFLVALCFAAAEGGSHLHLSPLLITLSAGALIANLDARTGERINAEIRYAGTPIFALFFAAAGAGLHLDALRVVGPAAVLLVGARALAIWFSCSRFAPREDPRLRKLLWMGLISQAGVTFGLASLVARTFPTFGAQVEVLIVAMVTLHELVGPILTRRALTRAGEARSEAASEAV